MTFTKTKDLDRRSKIAKADDAESFRVLINRILILFFIIQAGVLVYFNLFRIQDHIEYDSSWMYLKVFLMGKENRILTGPWVEQSNLLIDTSVLPALVFYKLTGNLFLSYGLSNVLILSCVVLCMNSILKDLAIGKTSRLFVLNLMIVPYMMNGYGHAYLGYSACFLLGPAFYNVRGLTALIVIKCLIRAEKMTRSDRILLGAAIALCLLSGLSVGIYLFVLLMFPLLVYKFYTAIVKDDISLLKTRDAVIIYILSLSILVGKIIGNLIGLDITDGSKTWTPISGLAQTALAPILGCIKFFGALPISDEDVVIMSVDGLLYLFPMFIFVVIILSLRYIFAKRDKEDSSGRGTVMIMLKTILIADYLVLALFNAVYGSSIFEERYLIICFLAVLIMVAVYLDELSPKTIFTRLLFMGLIFSIMITDAFSDVVYHRITTDDLQIREISAAIAQEDAEVIYVWGDDLFTLERILRVADLEHTYKAIGDDRYIFHNGDYTYHDEHDGTGATLLLVPADGNSVPDEIMDHYTMVCGFDSVVLYSSDIDPVVTEGMRNE